MNLPAFLSEPMNPFRPSQPRSAFAHRLQLDAHFLPFVIATTNANLHPVDDRLVRWVHLEERTSLNQREISLSDSVKDRRLFADL